MYSIYISVSLSAAAAQSTSPRGGGLVRGRRGRFPPFQGLQKRGPPHASVVSHIIITHTHTHVYITHYMCITYIIYNIYTSSSTGLRAHAGMPCCAALRDRARTETQRVDLVAGKWGQH